MMYWLLWFDADAVQLNRMARKLHHVVVMEMKNGCTVHVALVCIEGQRLSKNCRNHHRLLRINFSDSDSWDCV